VASFSTHGYTPSLTSASTVASDTGIGLKTPSAEASPTALGHRSKVEQPTAFSGLPLGAQGYGQEAEPYNATMNHSQTYLTSEPSHISTGPPYGAQSQTTGGMSQYPPYHQQPSMQSGPGAYGSAHAPYSTSYYGGLTSPQSANRGSASTNNHQLTPLSSTTLTLVSCYRTKLTVCSAMGMVPQQNGQYGNAVGPAAQGYSHSFDSTGQIPPPGVKPRVTATLWEDEGSLCFQVESKGVCVARREGQYNLHECTIARICIASAPCMYLQLTKAEQTIT
jgi:protein SOK2